MPYRTSRERFEELSEAAMLRIPVRYRRLFKNIAVIVEDYPSEDVAREMDVPRTELLGLFRGGSYVERESFFDVPYSLPDSIFLYQKNIEDICESESELEEEIRMTIFHEVGHYFGLSEEELEEFENPQ